MHEYMHIIHAYDAPHVPCDASQGPYDASQLAHNAFQRPSKQYEEKIQTDRAGEFMTPV